MALEHQAQRLLDRVKDVRFFRGQMYDIATDDFLREFNEFLLHVMKYELEFEHMRALLHRVSNYIAAEQRTSDRPQGANLVADIEEALKRRKP